MNWVDKLKQRWNLGTTTQVFLVLIAFAATGFTIMFLKDPVVTLFSEGGDQNIWFSVLYYLFILPVYNVLLLFYGFILGQFSFFWNFEKRLFKRISGKK